MAVETKREVRKGSRAWAKILYGALFVVLVPLGMTFFTLHVEVPVEMRPYPVPGAAIALAGLAVMLWGMWDIWRRGRGLPMNAFPPKELVTGGIYAIVPHPIYTGFVVACLGVSLTFGSAAGAYVTTPLAALSTMALVLGYERGFLLRTFGKLPRPLLGWASLTGPAVRYLGMGRLWAAILAATERLANSWSCRRFGPLRVMSHAIYAGLAGGVGAFLAVLMAGGERVAAVSALMLAGLAGAAAVGQLLVGSSNKLNRPFGYFGGLVGIALGGLLLLPIERAVPLVLAAFAFAGPWAQAIGRLRCLVQGCCHGAPSGDDPGIVVHNEHSRACGLAGLGGRRIYPTQLYSILGNVATGAILVALWAAGAPLLLIAGLYLASAGIVRFIEEGHRGEPATKVVAGLRIYQWFAVAMLAVGMAVMTLDSVAAPLPSAASLLPAAAVGLVFFVVCAFALSVDFPDSQRPLSRLSG